MSAIEIKVDNAGLVLYWPFLSRFFEKLEMAKEGEFVDNESRNRAAYLLQYLAHSQTDFPEYHFALNKLLVGMNLDDHLSPSFNLTEVEYEVSESLMYGLRNNWEKVKNSTPEGIQKTFIQREGILNFIEEKIELRVEKKGVDVLVESIPWNISIIKLPWMPYPMIVEWI
jgi:hypothetical protein